MKMNRRLVLAALGLLLMCVAQVWSMPSEKNEPTDYEAADEGGDEASEGDDVPDPVIMSDPLNLVVKVGSDVELPCYVINADEVAVTWSKNGTMLFLESTKIMQNDRIERNKNRTLIIHNVQTSDSDIYVCEVEITENKKQLIHKLRVLEHVDEKNEEHDKGHKDKLVRLTPKNHIELVQGGRVKLGCEYLGEKKPKSIRWFREGKRLRNSEETSTGIFLNVENATRHLAGDYKCMVDRENESLIVQTIKLRVKHVPEIEYEKVHIGDHDVPISDYYTAVGKDVNITCIVHSHPPVHKFDWLKDGQVLSTNHGHYTKNYELKSHHILTIHDVKKEDLGSYQCKAHNDLGDSVGKEIHLLDTPDRPIFMKPTSNLEDETVILQWRVTSHKPIVESELLYQKVGESQWHNGRDIRVVSSSGSTHIVQGKVHANEPGKYAAKLRSRNDEEHTENDADKQWGPFSEIRHFNGEISNEVERKAEGVHGAATRPTSTLMTLLLIISTFAYSFL